MHLSVFKHQNVEPGQLNGVCVVVVVVVVDVIVTVVAVVVVVQSLNSPASYASSMLFSTSVLIAHLLTGNLTTVLFSCIAHSR